MRMLFLACPVGRFGAGCARMCECENNAECDHKTGDCLCPPGWNGRRCDRST